MADQRDTSKNEIYVEDVLVIDYQDLQQDPTIYGGGCNEYNSDIMVKIERAFGPDGIGIIAVKNVPNFIEAKQRFLPMAHNLIKLPNDYLEGTMTDPNSLYNAGWSLGKEKLGDVPDYAKGSFYFNPCTDSPGSAEDRVRYPLSYPKNVWPTEHLPEFESAAKDLGLILKQVTVDLSKHLDEYLQSRVDSYSPNCLYDAMKETEKVKGRLLYYYPQHDDDDDNNNNNNNNNNEDAKETEKSWIGWHNDSGFLTALAGELYIDHSTGKLLDACPDPQAGLYVADRNDNLRRVKIPANSLAVQIGECSQILSGGLLKATPHWVKAAETKNVARISLAAFVDTPPDFQLWTPDGMQREVVCNSDQQSKRVPPLDKRWTANGMPFGLFLEQTFQMYYTWQST